MVAEKSFELQPNNDAHELVALIKKQLRLNKPSELTIRYMAKANTKILSKMCPSGVLRHHNK